MDLLLNQAGPVNLILAKMLTTNTIRSSVSVLSESVGQIHDLTLADHNLPIKLSEAFTIGSDEVAIHSGSRPCFTIWSATHLIKMALWAGSLIKALSLVRPNLLSNSIVYLGARNSGPNNIHQIVVSEISTC